MARSKKPDPIVTPAPRLDPPEINRLKREIDSLKSRLSNAEVGNSLITEAVRQSFDTSPIDLEIPKRPAHDKRRISEEVAVLHVCDTHIGKRTPTFDVATADQRLTMLVDKTIQITNARRSAAKIKELRLYLGGDIIDGELIYPSHAHAIEQSVFEQAVKTGPEIVARMILSLAESFEKIHVACVPGNHGRNGSKHNGSHPSTNWDSVCYETIKLMVCGTDKRPHRDMAERVTFDLPSNRKAEWYSIDRIFDWGTFQIHGHEITGGFGGYPWYGIGRRMSGWKDIIVEPWDYMFMGHFHTFADSEIQHRIFLANGTIVSDDVHGQANFASQGWPSQRLTFFDPHHGLIANHQIFLTDRRLPQLARYRAMADKSHW